MSVPRSISLKRKHSNGSGLRYLILPLFLHNDTRIPQKQDFWLIIFSES